MTLGGEALKNAPMSVSRLVHLEDESDTTSGWSSGSIPLHLD